MLDATTVGKWTPELADRLGPEGRLVLAGVSTDCCVLSTALAAADTGTEVLVVADACAGSDDCSHAKPLQVLDLCRPLVRVTTVDKCLHGPVDPRIRPTVALSRRRGGRPPRSRGCRARPVRASRPSSRCSPGRRSPPAR
ncbi:cysteine hydrolase family protein [Streptomyces herbicida]|uniref:cysteine hydrolase family protein n=1 Tax=Streptomyces herbicida TaxID=3065675 RepID=UPI0029314BAC|nr:isochorismatase family protein [Streptomyces sp. NEAU-HV9]